MGIGKTQVLPDDDVEDVVEEVEPDDDDTEDEPVQGAEGVEDEEGEDEVEEEEQSTPAVETPQSPPVDVEALQRLVKNAIREHDNAKEMQAEAARLEALYQEDPEEWARTVHERGELAKKEEEIREKARSEVSEEYYTGLFKEVLPQWRPYLEKLTDEEKRELDPYSPKWQSDAQYLLAVSEKVMEKRLEQELTAAGHVKAKETAEKGRRVVKGQKDAPPDVPGTGSEEGAYISPLTKDPREGMAEALREVLGGRYDEDDSD